MVDFTRQHGAQALVRAPEERVSVGTRSLEILDTLGQGLETIADASARANKDQQALQAGAALDDAARTGAAITDAFAQDASGTKIASILQGYVKRGGKLDERKKAAVADAVAQGARIDRLRESGNTAQAVNEMQNLLYIGALSQNPGLGKELRVALNIDKVQGDIISNIDEDGRKQRERKNTMLADLGKEAATFNPAYDPTDTSETGIVAGYAPIRARRMRYASSKEQFDIATAEAGADNIARENAKRVDRELTLNDATVDFASEIKRIVTSPVPDAERKAELQGFLVRAERQIRTDYKVDSESEWNTHFGWVKEYGQLGSDHIDHVNQRKAIEAQMDLRSLVLMDEVTRKIPAVNLGAAMTKYFGPIAGPDIAGSLLANANKRENISKILNGILANQEGRPVPDYFENRHSSTSRPEPLKDAEDAAAVLRRISQGDVLKPENVPAIAATFESILNSPTTARNPAVIDPFVPLLGDPQFKSVLDHMKQSPEFAQKGHATLLRYMSSMQDSVNREYSRLDGKVQFKLLPDGGVQAMPVAGQRLPTGATRISERLTNLIRAVAAVNDISTDEAAQLVLGGE